jgi:hypothetical protein
MKLPKLHENPSCKSRAVPCGRTDVTKPTVAFRSYAKVPKLEQECVSRRLRLLLVLLHSAYRNEPWYIFTKEKMLYVERTISVRPSPIIKTKSSVRFSWNSTRKFSTRSCRATVSFKSKNDIDIWLNYPQELLPALSALLCCSGWNWVQTIFTW